LRSIFKIFLKYLFRLFAWLSGVHGYKKLAGFDVPVKISNLEKIVGKFIYLVGDFDDYESGIINCHIRSKLNGSMIICGGGYGVTACSAMKNGISADDLLIYEGSSECIKNLRKTLDLNNCTIKDSNIIHAIVGDDIGVYAGKKASTYIAASDLPDCDILQLDIEGSELEVLRNIKIRPKTIIVETHGFLGSSTAAVCDVIKDLGYKIISIQNAENSKFARENDINVILAEKLN
jgi:hypothetical protein